MVNVSLVLTIDYLGHHIDSSGITFRSQKLTAIQNFPKPSNMRQLRRFVGMNAFYKKFSPKYVEIMRPIYALLSPQRYSKKAVLWNDEAEKAFHEINAKISSLVILTYPVKNAPTYLVTDTSEITTGAVLHQKINGDVGSQSMVNYHSSFVQTLISLANASLIRKAHEARSQ